MNAPRLFVTVTAVAAAMLVPLTGTADQVERGHALYQEACGVCHGPKGEGDGPLAPELRSPPANLTLIAKERNGVFPEAWISEFIDGRRTVRAHGPDSMPIWGKRFREGTESGPGDEAAIRDRISALIAYLKSIQKP